MSEGRCCDRGNAPRTNTSVRQSVVLTETREGQFRVDADVPSVSGETDSFVWVGQQSKVVRCCPEVQPLIVGTFFAVTPVDMLAVEPAIIQTCAWERQDTSWCE